MRFPKIASPDGQRPAEVLAFSAFPRTTDKPTAPRSGRPIRLERINKEHAAAGSWASSPTKLPSSASSVLSSPTCTTSGEPATAATTSTPRWAELHPERDADPVAELNPATDPEHHLEAHHAMEHSLDPAHGEHGNTREAAPPRPRDMTSRPAAVARSAAAQQPCGGPRSSVTPRRHHVSRRRCATGPRHGCPISVSPARGMPRRGIVRGPGTTLAVIRVSGCARWPGGHTPGHSTKQTPGEPEDIGKHQLTARGTHAPQIRQGCAGDRVGRHLEPRPGDPGPRFDRRCSIPNPTRDEQLLHGAHHEGALLAPPEHAGRSLSIIAKARLTIQVGPTSTSSRSTGR